MKGRFGQAQVSSSNSLGGMHGRGEGGEGVAPSTRCWVLHTLLTVSDEYKSPSSEQACVSVLSNGM